MKMNEDPRLPKNPNLSDKKVDELMNMQLKTKLNNELKENANKMPKNPNDKR